MRYTVSNPMIQDYAYLPQGSWDPAISKGAYWTSLNGWYPGDLSTLGLSHPLTAFFQLTPTLVPTWVSYTFCIPS